MHAMDATVATKHRRYDMSKFNEMGKTELRAACKAAGIAYGKLNNDGMRAALSAKFPEVQTPEVKTQPAPAAQPEAPVETKAEEAPVAPGPRAKVLGEVVQTKSLKIEKGRPRKNGVTRPSEGSICRAVWDALDAKRAALGVVPEFEHVRELMKANNWQRNTAFTQFQRWKQYNGVMPRDAAEDDAE